MIGLKTEALALAAAATLALAACSGGVESYPDAGPSTAPGLAAALPANEVANAVASGPVSREEAHRLLTQGTYGATLEDVDAVAASGPNAWIDAQMTMPATLMLPRMRKSGDTDRWNEQVNQWWRIAIEADDQLRQRVAFALSEILVVSSRQNGLGAEQEGLANYYDILVRNAFGNYRTLLEEVALNPIMGEYLSMKGNQKPDPARNIRPDENFARELLQLFTIGLEELNPDGTPKLGPDGVPLPTYDQETVEAFAHVFTGWHFDDVDDFRWAKREDYLSPMVAYPEFHDDGPKTLLGGVTLPAGQGAEADLAAALDNVFAHPNVAPFVSKQLIQRLVTSNPSPGYVADVAAVFASNSAGERGSLASTVKAILMHREAREGHLAAPDTFGKLKEPLLRVTQLWRAFEPRRIDGAFNYAWASNELAQAPLASRTVFNFFRPDFAQPGPIADAGLLSPEFEILDETSIVTLTGRLLASSIWNHGARAEVNPQSISIDIDREIALEPDPEALLDHLDLLLLGGRMTEALRAEARELMASRRGDQAALRVAEAIFLIATSPEAAVQI